MLMRRWKNIGVFPGLRHVIVNDTKIYQVHVHDSDQAWSEDVQTYLSCHLECMSIEYLYGKPFVVYTSHQYAARPSSYSYSLR